MPKGGCISTKGTKMAVDTHVVPSRRMANYQAKEARKARIAAGRARRVERSFGVINNDTGDVLDLTFTSRLEAAMYAAERSICSGDSYVVISA